MTPHLSLDALLDGAGLNTASPLEKQASQAPKPVVTTTAATELEAHLTKQAQEETPNMTTPAQRGQEIALGVLQLIKRATDDSSVVAGGNNLINETSAMVGLSNAGQLQNNNGNPNQVLQAAIANALANGAVHPDQLDLNVITPGVDGGNQHIPLQDMAGNYDLNAVGANQMAADQIEKVAAVASLIDNGYNFDQAVAMVKQAEQEILADEDQQVKVAAVNTLMGQGYNLDQAVALVKQAGVMGKVKDFLTTGVDQIRNPSHAHLAGLFGQTGQRAANAEKIITKGLAQGPVDRNALNQLEVDALRAKEKGGGLGYLKGIAPGLVVGGAGLGTVGAAGYGINRAMSKEAHVHACLAQGYSLEQALASLG